MFALDAASRTVLAAAAFAAFGAAFVTTPMTARGDAGLVAGPMPSVTALPRRTEIIDVSPRRDPFAGGDAPASRPSAGPPLPQIPAALRPLPPNAGASDAGFPFATDTRPTATVTAVITGPHPFALIDDAGATRMLTVGDRIAGELIVAIGAEGVRLTGGTMIAAPHGRPTPGGHQP